MSDYSSQREADRRFVRGLIKAGVSATLVVVGGVAGCMRWMPEYNVYSARMDGEAKLAHAQYERQVQVADAEGRLAAAHKLAEVEVVRAGGVAQANKIIGESLKENEAYLRYLWITDTMQSKSPTIIYVPTEANMPILEAGKRP